MPIIVIVGIIAVIVITRSLVDVIGIVSLFWFV